MRVLCVHKRVCVRMCVHKRVYECVLCVHTCVCTNVCVVCAHAYARVVVCSEPVAVSCLLRCDHSHAVLLLLFW